jgi:recombination protein RecT
MSMVLTTPQKAVRNTLVSMAKSLEKDIQAALPKHVTPERFLRVFQTAISSTPALLDCEPTSVIGSMVMASQLGLELNTPLGAAYLLPFKGKATLIVGYRGMIDLAMRSGRVKSIYAYEVHANDKFRYRLGSDPKIDHVPCDGDRGEFKGAYAVVVFKDGGSQFHFMTKAQVDKVRDASPGKNSGPWRDHYVEMAKKSCIRRLFKYLPVSIEIQKAVVFDEMMESNANYNAMELAGVSRPVIEGPQSLDDLASRNVPDAEFTPATEPDFTDEVNRMAAADAELFT